MPTNTASLMKPVIVALAMLLCQLLEAASPATLEIGADRQVVVRGAPHQSIAVFSSQSLETTGPWCLEWMARMDSSGVAQVPQPYAPEIRRFYKLFSPDGLVGIAPGSFTMGSPEDEAGRGSDEESHRVTFTHPYWIGRHEVTQEEYQSLMNANPSEFVCPSLPVESVTWYNAVEYCRRLTRQQRLLGGVPAGYVYRLPTEAEWENACRAGTCSAFHYGKRLGSGMANFYGPIGYDSETGDFPLPEGIFLGKTVEGGSYEGNSWGILDMHGNVSEWCSDWHSSEPVVGPLIDPSGPRSGTARVVRGGSWFQSGRWCRSACRDSLPPGDPSAERGFRVVLGFDRTP